MRTMNGRFTNRLPAQDTSNTAAEIGKNVGGAAIQAVLIVTAVRLVDAVFKIALADGNRLRAVTSDRYERV